MSTSVAPVVAVHRIEVRRRTEAGDPAADALLSDAADLEADLRPTGAARVDVYLLQGDLQAEDLDRIGEGLLADPVMQVAEVGATSVPPGHSLIEVHPLPGVMDPAAASISTALATILGEDRAAGIEIRTGVRWELAGMSPEGAHRLATRLLANPVVHAIHGEAYLPDAFPAGHERSFQVRSVEIASLDDDALERLSRDAHLFLSLEEMQAIQRHYRASGREPREIELESLAQTWSEHCVHKTLKATIDY